MVLYVVGAIILFNLALVAYIAGWEIASWLMPSKPEEATDSLPCECRRHAFPSPLCKKHWRNVA